MKKQNQIKYTLSKPENIKQINQILQNQNVRNRSELANIICTHIDFVDLKGNLQKAGVK